MSRNLQKDRQQKIFKKLFLKLLVDHDEVAYRRDFRVKIGKMTV